MKKNKKNKYNRLVVIQYILELELVKGNWPVPISRLRTLIEEYYETSQTIKKIEPQIIQQIRQSYPQKKH